MVVAQPSREFTPIDPERNLGFQQATAILTRLVQQNEDPVETQVGKRPAVPPCHYSVACARRIYATDAEIKFLQHVQVHIRQLVDVQARTPRSCACPIAPANSRSARSRS